MFPEDTFWSKYSICTTTRSSICYIRNTLPWLSSKGTCQTVHCFIWGWFLYKPAFLTRYLPRNVAHMLACKTCGNAKPKGHHTTHTGFWVVVLVKSYILFVRKGISLHFSSSVKSTSPVYMSCNSCIVHSFYSQNCGVLHIKCTIHVISTSCPHYLEVPIPTLILKIL